MSLQGWLIFASFWAVFVMSPGPNAVNCIRNGMAYGVQRSLWGVAAILTQATLFLLGSAAGVTALLAASPTGFFLAQLAGAAMLIWLGVSGWRRAARPLPDVPAAGRAIYARAFAIATLNPKSVAGYLAAFSAFVEADRPIAQQMLVILPTALSLTALSYLGWTALGAWLGTRALSALATTSIRRALALCLGLYGVALLGSTLV